ncbi:MAG: hypothetical protein ACREKB_14300, partial [Candidatus Rokuibacteriota bacterium]
MVSNYVGRSVPRVVGICLVGSSVAGFWLGAALAGRTGRLDAFDVAVVSAAIGLGGVGLLDDLFGGEARGLAGHLRSLLRGRPTTGILKLLAGIAGGAVIAWLAGGSLLRIVAGAVLISVGGNIWNALDVVPGRALKWGGLALAALLPAV